MITSVVFTYGKKYPDDKQDYDVEIREATREEIDVFEKDAPHQAFMDFNNRSEGYNAKLFKHPEMAKREYDTHKRFLDGYVRLKATKNQYVSDDDEIEELLSKQFSQAFASFKDGVRFVTANASSSPSFIILREHVHDDIEKELFHTLNELLEDGIDPWEGQEYQESYYLKMLGTLSSNFYQRRGRSVKSFGMPYELKLSISVDNEIFDRSKYVFPENNSDLGISKYPHLSEKEQDEIHQIISINDNLEFLKDDKYKELYFITYDSLLIITGRAVKNIMNK
jgi:hypothetical protein